MSKPTPGPWEFVPKLTASENHRGFFVRAMKATRDGKWALAEVQPGDEDGKLGEANSRLIAAAPELLEFAEEVRRSGDTRLANMAIAVIAQATGRKS